MTDKKIVSASIINNTDHGFLDIQVNMAGYDTIDILPGQIIPLPTYCATPENLNWVKFGIDRLGLKIKVVFDVVAKQNVVEIPDNISQLPLEVSMIMDNIKAEDTISTAEISNTNIILPKKSKYKPKSKTIVNQ